MGWWSTHPEVPVAPIQLTVQHPDFDTDFTENVRELCDCEVIDG